MDKEYRRLLELDARKSIVHGETILRKRRTKDKESKRHFI